MECRDLRGGGTTPSVAHPARCTGHRNGSGGGPLLVAKRGIYLCGAAGGPEGQSRGGSAGCLSIVRAGNSRLVQRTDGALAHGDRERNGYHWASDLLRNGEKRGISRFGREGRSTVAHSGAGNCRARDLHHGHDVDAVSATGDLYRIPAEFFRRDECRVPDSSPPAAWLAQAARGQFLLSAIPRVVHPGGIVDDGARRAVEAV